ncbi:hypothetical protein DFH07DRAFT_809157 [Mycena maculata]|uniref:Uncharacterized protein n=1 Tax=Mycena maculata TaxID=230809 RepID=A0AAD7NLQ7_9AGAR|nr:hypothetical protein DFH07DRAFT_809157 [Mycena maculata]
MPTEPLFRTCLLGVPGRYIPMAARVAIIALSLLALLAPRVSAQLRVGNLTNVLPQCETQCDAYDVMTTECNGVGVYEITYIYCECTPANIGIIEACFNCQSVNATQEAEMQELLDDIVNNCNDVASAPGSTVSVSPQAIVPSPSPSTKASNAAGNNAHLRRRSIDVILGLGVLVGALYVYNMGPALTRDFGKMYGVGAVGISH